MRGRTVRELEKVCLAGRGRRGEMGRGPCWMIFSKRREGAILDKSHIGEGSEGMKGSAGRR